MAKFSILPALRALSRAQPDTVNLAGGRAYSVSPRLELVSLLVTTFLEDEFYRTEAQTVARCANLSSASPSPASSRRPRSMPATRAACAPSATSWPASLPVP